MFEAQYLVSGNAVFGSWMERRGDNIIVTLDIIDNDNDLLVTMEVYHKDLEDAGDGAAATGTAISASTIQRHDTEYVGLKELVRIRVECGDADTEGQALLRTLAPRWFDSLAITEV
jgi:hypothetical protein